MSEQFVLNDHAHRRFNPLKNQWILVSPHRAKRPWQGQQEEVVADNKPSYDPTCYLCPGNKRITGEQNPQYTKPFVFKNDFSALLADTPAPEKNDDPLFQISHTHGQIWASNFLPNEITIEDECQAEYFKKYGSPLLVDYAKRELEKRERIVAETEDWIAVVPYWAAWPFETLLLPKAKQFKSIEDLNQAEREDLALALKKLTTRYDNLFNISFPYSMGFHFAPFNGEENAHWQLHAHFYPPLLRSATVRKFMVGYEMMAESQRDLTPEQATERLNAVSDSVHYKDKK